ncbi:thiamine diphosphokinase [Pikeienuella sp. HZG-20]|uniref:thiamine diphosphokinase n=1 Tax=Paludibacillus litoralis TaxID=3133267 RepID=UPI0030ECCDE0
MRPEETIRVARGATLLGAGPEAAETAGALDEALARAAALICADGGANALPAGLTPDAIIGDLDSLEDVAGWRRRLGARLIHVPEQETTDLEKCLLRVEAAFFLCVGFLGGRVDHQLAALHALITDPRPILMIGAEDVIFSAGVSLSLDLEPGDRISIFPMRTVASLSGRGLRWPVDGLRFEAGARVGTSNEATGPVTLDFDRAGAVVILPRARLDAALQGLLKQAEPRGDPDRG